MLGEKHLTKRARSLRRDMTDAERRLWSRLRNRQIAKTKFVKQFPVGSYVADFAARSLRLVIELDGGRHSESRDAERTRVIEAIGYRVIRFWNNDVMENIEGVLEAIAHEIHIARGEKPPLPQGRGLRRIGSYAAWSQLGEGSPLQETRTKPPAEHPHPTASSRLR